MPVFTVHEAKSQLSRLMADAERGEEVVVARGSEPVIRLVPINQTERPPRRLGRLRGRGAIADEHWASDEVQTLFGVA